MRTRFLPLALLLFTGMALADTPPARVINAELYDAAGNPITSTAGHLDVNSVSSALPSGAATETTLGAINGKLGSLGQKAMVGSAPVVLSSDQSAIPVTQSGAYNITNITGTVSLPTGAATAANQAAGNLSLGSIDTKLTTTGNGLAVDGSAVVQPISAGALPLPAGASTESTLSLLNGKVTTTGNGIKVDVQASALPTGAATSSLQSTGNSSLSSLDGKVSSFDLDSGAGTESDQGVSLRFAASGGSVPAGTSSNPLRTDPTGTTTQPISAASLPLPTGAATQATLALLNTKVTTSANGILVDGSTVTQPISASALPLPTGASTETTLSALNGKFAALGAHATTSSVAVNIASDQVVPISATALPLPTGAATSALQTSGNSSLSSIDTKTPALVSGRVPVDGSGVTQPVVGTGAAGTAATGVVTVQGIASMVAIKTDGSATTQPVSGTVSAAQSGTWNINNIGGTVSLPTGASTAAKQPALGTAGTASADVITVQGIASMTALKVDGSAVTQPISAASLPLPAGAATSALQTTGNTSIGSIDTKTPALVSGRVPVDGSGVTQPVSGTITANIGTTNGLALDATVAKLNVAQGAALGTNTGPMGQGVATTGPPTYTTATINPLSLTTAGALRTDSSGTTQPVSGTVTANQGGTWTTGRTWALSTGTDAVLAAQSGTWTVQPGNTANTTPWLTTLSQGGNAAAVTAGNALKVDGSAVTQPISASALPLPSGAATSALQTTGNSSLSSIDTKTPALVSGRVPVDGSGVTQPVSGTVTANAGSGTFAISAASLPLPAGAATAAKQPALGTAGTASTDVITVQGIASMTALKVDGSAVTQPVSGTVAATQSGVWSTGRTWSLSTGTDSILAAQSGTWNINNISGTVTLPTGASSAVNQITANNSLASIDGKLPATLGQKAAAAALAVVTQADEQPATANITVQDTGSSSTTGANNQAIVTGSPTASSTASFTLASWDGVTVQVSGTWTGSLQLEVSPDNGTTWYSRGGKQDGVGNVASAFTANFEARLNVSGMTNFRVRATTAITGTATVLVNKTTNINDVTVTNSLLLKDATTQSIANTIKAASTAAQASDTALVVGLSPNSALPLAADKTGSGTITATDGTVVAQTAGSASLNFVVSGTWSATLNIEASSDGGTTWFSIAGDVDATDTILNSFTTNGLVSVASGGYPLVRLRANPYTSGTVNVSWASGAGVSLVEVFNTNAASLLAQVSGPTLTSIDNKTPALGQTTQALSQPEVQPGDFTSTVGSITVQDTGSTVGTQANNQTIITGSATAGSTFSIATNGYSTGIAKVTGTWTGSVELETSVDGGTTWIPLPTHQIGGSIFFLAYTSNVQMAFSAQSRTNVRVRAPSAMTGTASVQFILSYNSNGIVFVNNAVRITDGSNSSVATPLTVLAGSTAAGAGNTSAVVALSPNSPVPAGTNLIGQIQISDGTNVAAITGSGAFTVTKVDGVKATYSAASAGLADVTGATDVFTLTGSASKTIRIVRIGVSGTAATGTSINVSVTKHSTADTGGTSTTPAAVPHDSTSSAATGVARAYTANPTVGTVVGTVRTLKLALSTVGTPSPVSEALWGDDTGQAIVLRGTGEQLALNFNAAAVTTGNVDVFIEWTEE